MECNYCHNQFNQSANIPRLLIFCGHSLCEMCCCKLHTNNRIQCPQCCSNTFIEEINFLPKNLALLKVNNYCSISTSNQLSCLKHQKKYQAFCEKEKALLCVDCILQDGHRNHNMDSIKNSFHKQLSTLEQKLSSLDEELEKIRQRHKKNKDNQSITIKNYKQCQQNITNYFDELRSIIDKEEKGYHNKIQQQYETILSSFQNKNQQFSERANELSECLESIKASYQPMNEIIFLDSVTTRTAMMDSLNIFVEECEKILTMTYTKNQIADSIIKNIDKNYKILQPVLHQNAQPGVGVQKKGQNLGGNVKNFKKNAGTNIQPTYKNVPKKAVRRQTQGSVGSMPQSAIFSGVSQNSNTSSTNPNNGRPNSQQVHHPTKNRHSSNVGSTSISKQKRTTSKTKQIQHFEPNMSGINNRICDLSVVQQKQSMFNSFMSNMTSFLLHDKKSIFVIGGFDPENSNMLKFNLSLNKWEQICRMNAPRSKFGCFVNPIDQKSIMMLGGKKGKERVADSQVWVDGNWKVGSNLKKKKSGFGVVTLDNFVYIVGGNDGDSILNTVDVLNLKNGEWKKKQSMNQVRDQLALCLGADNKIYAIGGFGGKNNEPLKSAQMYDPVTDKWSNLPPLKTPRRALAAASLADGIYAIGGFDGQKYLNSVQKYEVGFKQWVKVTDLNKARCTHSAVTIYDSQQILVLGGFDEVALDSVQKYSLVTNQWEYMTPMPGPRFMHCSVLVNQ